MFQNLYCKMMMKYFRPDPQSHCSISDRDYCANWTTVNDIETLSCYRCHITRLYGYQIPNSVSSLHRKTLLESSLAHIYVHIYIHICRKRLGGAVSQPLLPICSLDCVSLFAGSFSHKRLLNRLTGKLTWHVSSADFMFLCLSVRADAFVIDSFYFHILMSVSFSTE